MEQLENRLSKIDNELGSLAHFTLRSGVGNVGWISKRRKRKTAQEWIEVQLPEDSIIDQIVLTPLLWNNAQDGPQADGFPEAFAIVAGDKGTSIGRLIAKLGPEDQFLPRIAPLLISIPPTKASWIRIRSKKLSPDARTGRFTFCLSEVMVFSGERNIALNQPVRVSSSIGGWGESGVYKEGLVDGSTPFLMDAASGENSTTFKAFSEDTMKFSAIIDLGQAAPINGIRIHGADLSEYVPQLTQSDFGMPSHFVIHGANRSDFSDAVVLWDHRLPSVYASGPILGKNLPDTTCRYVRFSTDEPYKAPYTGISQWSVILAEIEILSEGRNIAKNMPVRVTRGKNQNIIHLSALTDGRNHFGDILPYREWMAQLARRHELEKVRPPVAAAIKIGYSKQKEKMTRMYWLIVLLAAGIIFTFLVDRIMGMRAIAKIRERIAADMHDELGANLHTIGLLSDSAQASQDSEAEWEMLHQRIRKLTEQTGKAIRRYSKVVDTTGGYDGLIEDMERTALRITGQFEHRTVVEGAEHLGSYRSRPLIDIYLFYKECLVNIYRHSQATQFETHLGVTRNEIILTVTDNGQGIPEALEGKVPPSLKRRARLARGKLTMDDRNEGGTCVILRVPNRRLWFPR
ncbi:sensor histidine kinase [Luteolibacter sp. AS25]|uniref:sensor histidine kinase n=1 Tax=Luteolibacter sp. AS25 TaxID=3135776 RepID=UPI00398B6572